jgi:hypothetical protein
MSATRSVTSCIPRASWFKRFRARVRHWFRRLPSRIDGSAIDLRADSGCEISPRAFVRLGARRPPQWPPIYPDPNRPGVIRLAASKRRPVAGVEFDDDLPIG